MKAIYPGSFDPITNGHMDILDRSLRLFDEITMVVAETGIKNPLLSVEERVGLIETITSKHDRVRVESWSGLIMEYAKDNNIHAVVRGLRAASDFEYEFMMASMNRNIGPDVETVFIMSSQNLYFVSSTMIRELYRFGGDIAPYVPKEVVSHLKGRSK